MIGVYVIRSIIRNLWLVILFPLVMGFTVYYLTRQEVKTYESRMTIYTGISAAKLGLGEGTKLDFFTANNAMDNLIAIFKGRNTIQDATIRLMAMHLMATKHDATLMSWETFQEFKDLLPDTLLRKIKVAGNIPQTEIKIKNYIERYPQSQLARLFIGHRHYGVDPILERIKAMRRASSDMIDITFEADDAPICMHTLRLLADAYFLRYLELKRSQNSSAVEYFQMQLGQAGQKLRASEDQLKSFISENKILNYYEQGKSLSVYEKEEEQEEQDVRQAALGAEAAIKAIEEKLSSNKGRSITIDSLTSLRNEITDVRARLQSMLLNKAQFADEIKKSRERIQLLYDAISRQVSTLYLQDYSIEGLPSNQLLTEWLNLFTEREKQLSYLELVTASKNMVTRRIEEFAPLGAELKRLEREVSVNESQYLSILHGLNMANLQRQSVEQASTQSLIDEPFLPREPRKSKRMMLVVAAAFAGAVLVVGIIIARIILDGSLKNAENTEAVTGLKVIGSLPVVAAKKPKQSTLDTLGLSMNHTINEIVATTKLCPQSVLKIVLYPANQNDNVAFGIGHLNAALLGKGFTSNGWLINSKNDEPMDSLRILEFNKADFLELAWEQFVEAHHKVVLAGLPPMNSFALPIKLIKGADLVVAVVNSKRQWQNFDRRLADEIETLIGNKPLILLQNVETDHLKDFFGYIPVRTILGRPRKIYR